MATYKVKATITIGVELDIDATNEKEAISKFIQMDTRDAINDADITDVNTDRETAEISSGIFKVKTTKISYDITEEDLYDEFLRYHPELEEDSEEFYDALNAEVEKVRNSLPQELFFEIECDKEDLDDYVSDYVSDETGWLVNYADYEIEGIE